MELSSVGNCMLIYHIVMYTIHQFPFGEFTLMFFVNL